MMKRRYPREGILQNPRAEYKSSQRRRYTKDSLSKKGRTSNVELPLDDSLLGNSSPPFLKRYGMQLASLIIGIVLGIFIRGLFVQTEPEMEFDEEEEIVAEQKRSIPDLFNPVREAPESFKRDTFLPAMRESEASVAIADVDFSPGRDLVYVEDVRVWWESDNDDHEDDYECDHSMHAAMEIPFRRLSNLVAKTGKWELRVQEAFREWGVHSRNSLHKQDRALDITVERLHGEKLTFFEKRAAYEELAKLAWQAGFDWVYYEHSRGTGPHIHASVRPDGEVLTRKTRPAAMKAAEEKMAAMKLAQAEDTEK
ncbi:MAG: hypothetical protein GX804_11285 [Lentisphaerae bacterium]|nr:hypothetical protein [Lentisphaerota bacterium]